MYVYDEARANNWPENDALVESKIFTIKITSVKEKFVMKEMNSSQREIIRGNNGILKTTISESYSKGVNDTEREDRSIWERKEDTITEITYVDQLDKMYSPQDECEESKGEIKNPGKIDNVAMSGKRAHQHPFCDIVDNREQRREELEKMEGDMRKRLDILECSMPAVMVWNILKMSQGAPVCSIGRILEKQFKHTRELSCRSTPSCHYDCRVREVEAERKLALKKTEEARTLWSEKLATLEKRKRELEEARRIQEEQKNAIECLNEEAKALREAIEKRTMEVDESCQYGECGDTQCKQRWLSEISSVTSIESEDIQCLEKLQQLAEEEVIMKRGITELERREEAYMRTLQQADELWSKMEGDGISMTSALQEQLDTKIAANQQLADRVCELEDALEKCQAKLAACRTELEKFLSIEKIEATIGRDDDVAQVTDKAVAVRAKVVHRPIGRVDDVATVEDGEVQARVEVADEEALAKVEVADEEALARIALIDADVDVALVRDDKYVSVKPDLADLAVDRPADLVRIEDAESIVRPEDIIYEQLEAEKVREYLAKLGSLEELYKDGEPCAPEFVCNDVVTSPTGMTDEELIALGIDPKKLDEKLTAREEERDRQFPEKLAKDVVEDIEKKEKKADEISIEIETRPIIKAIEEIAETVDVPVRKIVTRQVIREEVVDDKPVTIPIDVRALEVEKIETDQAIVIQRDTILSWIDMIDTIRTSAAKHPDCHTVKKDADVLIEQVGAHVGIKPKKVEEEKIIIITEDKREKVIEENEIKVKERVIIETKLSDELIVSKDRKIELLTKDESIPSIPSPRPEETSVEVKAPTESVAELLSTLTKEEISVGVEPPTAVSIENSFQFPTIPVKEDLKSVTVPTTEPVPYEIEIEKTEIEEETQVKEIVHTTKEAEVSQVDKVKKSAAFKDLTDKELAIEKVINDKIMNSAEEEKTLIVQKIEKEEEEIIPEHVKIDEKKIEDIPIKKAVIEKEEAVAEKVGIDERLSVSEEIDESKYVEVDQIIPEIVSPTVDLIKTEKIERGELLIADAEKVPILNTVSEKITQIEEPPPSVDAKEELLTLNAMTEEKIEIEEPSITDIIQKEIKIEKVPITDIREIIEEKESIKEIVTEKKMEIPPVTERIIQEEIEEVIPDKKIEIPLVTERIIQEEIEEVIPDKKIEIPLVTERIIQEEIEKIIPEKKIEIPSVTEQIIQEEIKEIPEKKIEISPVKERIIQEEIKEIIPEKKIEIPPVTERIIQKEIEEIIPEKKIEIPPVIERIIQEEIEEINKIETIKPPVPKAEINKGEDKKEIKEMAKEVTPSIKLFEEIEKEEILSVEKEEISAKIAVSTKQEKKLELVEIELKIPIADIKPTEIEVPVIPINPRLLTQPYLIIAKIKEKELSQIAPAMKLPCQPPPTETAELVKIMQTNVAQTEIMQTKVVDNEIVETEIVETEIVETEFVEITTQTITAAEPPPMPSIPVISQYLKPAEIKALSTEIAGGRPEITGRKMPSHKRLKDQSTVMTVSAGSQTDKTSHVSHNRVARDERERARVTTDELLRSIKIAAGLARPDAEREIRTINYGGRSDEIGKVACNCCQCGKISTPPSTKPRLKTRPQTDAAKTATPTAVAAAFKRIFISPKTDRPISYDRLCSDCIARIQGRVSREKYHIEKISRDQGSCDCASSIDKSCRRAVPRRREIEKKDQGCLAKMPKRKTNLVEQKRKDDLRSILEDPEKIDVEPLSPSCICYKSGKTSVQPIRKGNCYCGD
ncbi:titin homolog [Polyergus mexicanus]|uniref:titin homolog n=1 Tax=Polyergus mexicanus TaxID=615972 RepID=UPI0038B46659